MTRLYAIGDIHGQLAKLRAAHARIAADRARTGDMAAPVVHLGDLVDRGPDSRGVIAHLAQGIAAGHPWVALCGNHDLMFRDILAGDARTRPDHWLQERIGGRETLQSYGIALEDHSGPQAALDAARVAVPAAHRAFLDGLRLWHEGPGVLCVHAGIRPGVALAAQDIEDLCWIREEFHRETAPHPWLVVHGHTPVAQATHYGNRVNIDTGAGFGRALSAAVIEDGAAVWLLAETGRVPLIP